MSSFIVRFRIIWCIALSKKVPGIWFCKRARLLAFQDSFSRFFIEKKCQLDIHSYVCTQERRSVSYLLLSHVYSCIYLEFVLYVGTHSLLMSQHFTFFALHMTGHTTIHLLWVAAREKIINSLQKRIKDELWVCLIVILLLLVFVRKKFLRFPSFVYYSFPPFFIMHHAAWFITLSVYALHHFIW